MYIARIVLSTALLFGLSMSAVLAQIKKDDRSDGTLGPVVESTNDSLQIAASQLKHLKSGRKETASAVRPYRGLAKGTMNREQFLQGAPGSFTGWAHGGPKRIWIPSKD